MNQSSNFDTKLLTFASIRKCPNMRFIGDDLPLEKDKDIYRTFEETF